MAMNLPITTFCCVPPLSAETGWNGELVLIAIDSMARAAKAFSSPMRITPKRARRRSVAIARFQRTGRFRCSPSTARSSGISAMPWSSACAGRRILTGTPSRSICP